METKSQDLIRQIKRIKRQEKITFNDILNALPKENGVPILSLTTLRRVCASGSESHASSFNYEETLLPIAEAVREISGYPEGSPQMEEIKTMNTEIHYLKTQLSEKDALVERLVERLDQKDEIIHQFLLDMKQKDEIIQNLMAKCL